MYCLQLWVPWYWLSQQQGEGRRPAPSNGIVNEFVDWMQQTALVSITAMTLMISSVYTKKKHNQEKKDVTHMLIILHNELLI